MTRPRSISCIAPHAVFAGALALGVAACGGEDRGRPEPTNDTVEAVDYCELEDSYELQPIVEFSGEADARCDPAIEAQIPGMCTFYFNYDFANSLTDLTLEQDIPRCSQVRGPDAFLQITPPIGNAMRGEVLPEARCDQAGAALHVRGTNVGMCFGALTGRLGWGGSAEIAFPRNFDATTWDGIAFWIRRGGPASQSSLLFTVSDRYTHGIPPIGTPEQLFCKVAETAPDSEKCDAFGVAVTLSDEWNFIAVPFSALRQKGFGSPSPQGAIDVSQLRSLHVLFSAGDWDFWIDDISFFRGRR